MNCEIKWAADSAKVCLSIVLPLPQFPLTTDEVQDVESLEGLMKKLRVALEQHLALLLHGHRAGNDKQN